MTYRGSETRMWLPEERARFVRIVAACVLVTAGWSVGFFSGRMSAWFFPVDRQVPALVALKEPAPEPARVAKAPAETRSSDQKSGPAQPNVSASAPAESATGQDHQPPGQLPSNQPEDKAGNAAATAPAEPPETSAKPPQRGATLMNQDWARASLDPRQPDRSPAVLDEDAPHDTAAIGECERRYSSFRRSDGTYQPYGRASREVCPFLRFRN
jgi:BA14K-like protein